MSLFAASALVVIGVVALVWVVGSWMFGQFASFNRRRRARAERELDRTQAEMRATILRLASELGGDAHEARKALIRESFLASGTIPDKK